MAIVLRRATDLDLCIIEFSGEILLADMAAHFQHRALHRELLMADALYLVHPDAIFSDLSPERLADFRTSLKEALKQMKMPVLRRKAWICRSEATLPFLHAWLSDRSKDDGLYVSARIVETLEEAADWLGVAVETLRLGVAGAHTYVAAEHPPRLAR